MPNKKTFAKYSGYLFLLPYLTLFSVFLLLPLFYGFGLSFSNWEMLSPEKPHYVGFANYTEAFNTDYFIKAIIVTFKCVLMIVPFVIIGAFIIALGINALPDKSQDFFRAAFFLPTIISISVAGILWRWFYSTEFGIFNSWLSHFGLKVPWLTDIKWAMRSIVFMTFWWTLGGPMIIILAGLKQIPDSYYEAADIDGANSLQKFFYITIPLLKPILLFVVVMNVIASFQVFGQTFMITRGGPELSTRTLVQYIYETSFTNYRIGYGSAMSWILFLIIAIFSIIQFKIMREKA